MKKKNSGLGIASFILSILAGLSIFAVLVIAGVIETANPGGMSEDSVEAVILGLLILGLLFASVVALGLGIAGLFQNDRNKIFAILGTIFASLSSLCTVSVILVGIALG